MTALLYELKKCPSYVCQTLKSNWKPQQKPTLKAIQIRFADWVKSVSSVFFSLTTATTVVLISELSEFHVHVHIVELETV